MAVEPGGNSYENNKTAAAKSVECVPLNFINFSNNSMDANAQNKHLYRANVFRAQNIIYPSLL